MKTSSNNEIPDWLLRQLPYDHSNIDVGKKNMHVMDKGSGKPIVLIHGNPMWGYLYKKVLDQLDNTSARLIVPDLIGFGFSSVNLPNHPRGSPFGSNKYIHLSLLFSCINFHDDFISNGILYLLKISPYQGGKYNLYVSGTSSCPMRPFGFIISQVESLNLS